jgi:hypothetical protein
MGRSSLDDLRGWVRAGLILQGRRRFNELGVTTVSGPTRRLDAAHMHRTLPDTPLPDIMPAAYDRSTPRGTP